MTYIDRLYHAFVNAPILPITPDCRYIFISDCHRGIGNNNDNFLKNENCYLAAIEHYYQYGYTYVEVGDGDELWENRHLNQIIEIHNEVYAMLSRFQKAGRLYILYGNHDMEKMNHPQVYEGIIFRSSHYPVTMYVTHGHQADYLNSVLWKLARFLVRNLWAPLEHLGFQDPTSAAKNNSKKARLEKRYLNYARRSDGFLLVGHTHRPTLGNDGSPYVNCGSCVHPKSITCIELNGYQMNLVKWSASSERNPHFGNIYAQYPPTFPLYITREVLGTLNLQDTSML